MPKINQVEVLRIFHKHNKDFINENNYGVHINVTNVQDSVLQEIESILNTLRNKKMNLLP